MSITINKTIIRTRPISVDYSLSLYRMIGLTGVSWFNPDITPERFVIDVGFPQKKDFGVIRRRDFTFEEAIFYIKQHSCRPAKFEELLTFAATYPNLKWNPPIIALGTTGMLNGSYRVAFLHQWESDRDIRLTRIDKISSKQFQFAFTKQIPYRVNASKI
jgi:hypothetical protein